MKIRSILLPLLLLASGITQAQRFYFDNIGVQNGLPASKVYAIVEDATGMIWVGTEAGISRFDGENVISYGTGDGVAPNGGRSLFKDDQGRVWAGHLGGGLSLYEKGKWRTLKLKDRDLTSDISSITQDTNGDVWFTTYGQGAVRVVTINADNTIDHELFSEAEGLDAGLSQVLLSDGMLHFINSRGMMYRRAKDGSMQNFLPKGLPSEESIITAFEDSKGSLWIGTRIGGAYELDKDGVKGHYFIANGLPSNFILSFGEDAKGQVWIGTFDRGIGRVQQNGIQMFHDRNGLHDNMIRCIVRDREGNMMVGTNINGLDIYKGERFINFTDADGLVDPQVWAVLEDREGHVWFGTNRVISFWDPSENSTARVKTLTAQQNELECSQVRCMKEDAQGRIWVGTQTNGLFELDPRILRPRSVIEVNLPDNRVTALEIDRAGAIWVGSMGGLINYRPGAIPVVYNVDAGLPSANITALFKDKKGVLWIGTMLNGISRMEGETIKPVDLGKPFTPTCVIQDNDGRLWIGTEGQGVFVMKDEELVATYSTDDGLLANTIKALNIDANGHIWIGSTRGLNRWIPDGTGFISYTERAGYIGIETKLNATCTTRAGHIWFGTANGATRVSTDKALDEVPVPIVALRALKVDQEERPLEAGASFDHSENNIRLSFGSVSLSDPAAVRYAYMLDGVENDWQPPSTATEAHYPALQPGSYEFKVKAMNRSGQWSEPAVFNFTILPPWYRSWWFYTILVISIGISMFSYIKVRERQLRVRNIVLERKVQERTAEVVAQSKEIEGQKQEIEGLLLNILPKEISEELKASGKAMARRHDNVTVLFTDMKGFTKVAEQMTPEELVRELDECFIHFDEITSRYGIEKIKTIGDSYMCACGVPVADQHHALKSVLAALEVRDLMDGWRKEREAKGKDPWILRIGIHSGPVVAGVVGKKKFAYDIWSDTVNTASRMESSGMPGEVNISGTTYALIKEYFECEHRGQVEAKNKGKIDMYFVRRLKPQYSADGLGLHPNAELLRRIGVAQVVEELA
jgi:ligand-binding sensor domain-containing protein/class 3 adenylate cyclase